MKHAISSSDGACAGFRGAPQQLAAIGQRVGKLGEGALTFRTTLEDVDAT
jgi:hypothetical protein